MQHRLLEEHAEGCNAPAYNPKLSDGYEHEELLGAHGDEEVGAEPCTGYSLGLM